MRRRVRIVGLVGMRQHAVGERRFDRRRGERCAGDRRCPLRSIGANVALRRLAGRQFRPGDHRRQGVEEMVLGLLGDLGRQRAGSGSAHIGAERGHLWSGPDPSAKLRAGESERLVAAAAVRPRKSRRFMVSRLWCRN